MVAAVKARSLAPWAICAGLILTTACTAAGSSPAMYAASAAPVVTSSDLQPTIAAAQVEAYLAEIEARQGAERYQVTLNAAYAASTATAQAQHATATARAWEAQERAAAQSATATAMAWQTTVQAQQAQATATSQAQQATATADAERFHAQATATESALRAQAQATAMAWGMQATATAEAWRTQATVQAAQADKARLDAERERMIYPLKAFGPWAILAMAVVFILWGGYRLVGALEMRLRVVNRDARGDAPLLVLRTGRLGIAVVDADRSMGPATLLMNDSVSQPALADPDRQAQVTARDQAVDLAHRGLPAGSEAQKKRVAQAARMLTAEPQPEPVEPRPLPAGLRIVPPAEVRRWLDDVKPKALAAAITDREIIGEEK